MFNGFVGMVFTVLEGATKRERPPHVRGKAFDTKAPNAPRATATGARRLGARRTPQRGPGRCKGKPTGDFRVEISDPDNDCLDNRTLEEFRKAILQKPLVRFTCLVFDGHLMLYVTM